MGIAGNALINIELIIKNDVSASSVDIDNAISTLKELAEKGFLTSSCCPAFVQYIKSSFPNMLPYVSHNLSPMATLAKYLKERTNAHITLGGNYIYKIRESLKTMPEFFERRYGSKRLKLVSAVIVFVFLIPYSASVYNGLSNLFEAVFSIPGWVIMVVLAAIVILIVRVTTKISSKSYREQQKHAI